MAFRVGQEVTLRRNDKQWRVERGFGAPEPSTWRPVFGAVYVVRDVATVRGDAYLFFDASIDGFCAQEFRPVVKPTTDISVFTRMLDEARSPELVT